MLNRRLKYSNKERSILPTLKHQYSSIAVLISLKKQNIVIKSIRQGQKSIEERQDYSAGLEITYRERELLMDIEKTKDNYNKDEKPKCFNCNIPKYIVKDCRKPKNEKETRKCCKKCDKVRHLAKNCRLGQNIKNKSI